MGHKTTDPSPEKKERQDSTRYAVTACRNFQRIHEGVELKFKLSLHWNLIGRVCYRPAVFFHHFFSCVSISARKSLAPLKNVTISVGLLFFKKNCMCVKLHNLKLCKSGSFCRIIVKSATQDLWFPFRTRSVSCPVGTALIFTADSPFYCELYKSASNCLQKSVGQKNVNKK